LIDGDRPSVNYRDVAKPRVRLHNAKLSLAGGVEKGRSERLPFYGDNCSYVNPHGQGGRACTCKRGLWMGWEIFSIRL